LPNGYALTGFALPNGYALTGFAFQK
jgi:hypothetical protein